MSIFSIYTPEGALLAVSTVLIVVGLMFSYTFVGICAGFGGGLTSMPLITLLLPVKMAAPMSVLVGTATALYATWLSRKEVDWRSSLMLIACSALGVPVGIYALSYFPDSLMKMGLGGFLILYSFYSLFIPKLPIYDKNWLAAPMGAIAGALGAAFSTNGPPVVIYGMLRNLGPAAFRGTLNAFFTANNLLIISGLATSGILTISTFKLVLFSIPTMILGCLVGQWVHKRMPVAVFRKVVFILLIASGSMLIKGAAGIPAVWVLGATFGTLILCQLLFGKKVAMIRALDKQQKEQHQHAQANLRVSDTECEKGCA